MLYRPISDANNVDSDDDGSTAALWRRSGEVRLWDLRIVYVDEAVTVHRPMFLRRLWQTQLRQRYECLQFGNSLICRLFLRPERTSKSKRDRPAAEMLNPGQPLTRTVTGAQR